MITTTRASIAMSAAAGSARRSPTLAGCDNAPAFRRREIDDDAFRSLRDQCSAAGVPFFFKQWGAWTPGVNVERQRGVVETAEWFDEQWLFGHENLARTDGHCDDEPDLYRVGKKAAGHLLDGVAHLAVPEVGQ